MPCKYIWLPGCRPLRRDSSTGSAAAGYPPGHQAGLPVTRCSREGSDASPLGAAAIAESSPRSMDVPALASAAAAAFLLTHLGLQQCSWQPQFIRVRPSWCSLCRCLRVETASVQCCACIEHQYPVYHGRRVRQYCNWGHGAERTWGRRPVPRSPVRSAPGRSRGWSRAGQAAGTRSIVRTWAVAPLVYS
jgi:hypothetical protein